MSNHLLNALEKAFMLFYDVTYSVRGKVKSIDEEKYTIDVDPDDSSTGIKNAVLRSIAYKNDLGIIFIPKLKSKVTIGFIKGNRTLPVVIKVQEIDKVIIKIDGFSKIEMTEDHIMLGEGDNKAGNIKIVPTGVRLGKGLYGKVACENTNKVTTALGPMPILPNPLQTTEA